MIPKKLILKGFLSFKNLTEIDFDKLTQENLFGIFGAIGSGKSAILDAISFALFDENYRNLTQEQLININSEECLVKFIFEVNCKVYEIHKTLKKNSKKVFVYEENTLIADSVSEARSFIQNLLNLNYQKFIKTIVIPQGNYQELLLNEDYYALLKDYLGIPDITIPEKIKTFQNHLKNQIQLKKSIMESIESSSNEETLKELEIQKYKFQKIISTISKELEQKKLELNEKQEIYKNYQKFEELQAKLQKNIIEKENYDKLKNQIEHNEKIYLDFSVIISEKRNLENKKIELEKKKQELWQEIQKLEPKLKRYNKIVEEINKKNTEIKKLKILFDDYQILDKISIYEKNKLTLQKESEIAIFQKNQFENQLNQTLRDIMSLKDEIKSLEAELESLSEDTLQLLKKTIKNILDAQDIITKQEQQIKKIIYETLKIKVEDIDNSEIYLQKLELLKGREVINLKLSDLSVSLKEGEPCFLCGSIHHPKKFEPLNENEIKHKIKLYEDTHKKLNDILINYRNSVLDYESNLQLLESYEYLYKYQSLNDIDLYLESKIEHYKVLKKELENRMLQKIELDKRVVELTQKIKSAEERLVINEKKIEEITLLILNEKHKLSNSELASDSFEQEWLKNELNTLDEYIKQYYNEKENNENLLNNLKIEYSELQVVMQKINQDLENNYQEIEQIWQKINQLILDNELINLEEVLHIVNTFDFNEVKKQKFEIENFTKSFNKLQGELKVYEEKIYGKAKVEESVIRDLEQDIQEDSNQLEVYKKEFNQVEVHIKQHKENIRKKQILEEELFSLENRLSITNEFSRACYADQFKNFIVDLYLEDFREEVNRNLSILNQEDFQLVKEIDANGKSVIKVEDFRNGNQKRSLKSLSGGQSFLTAFAIGLTISNQIHKGKTKSFFFIDEGFGTLDSDSLQQVKQLLFQLRNQNRIIGIITHVNELQDCITQKIILERKNDGTKVSYL